MKNPLISVIVPVYNVEKYLDRCVQSLVRQTYAPLEIILVDDGSPDNCPALCDAYTEKYPNVRVVHKKNGGLSSARNAGVDVARGEFIAFVDSDDWVAEDTYEYALQLAAKHNADCVQFGFKQVSKEQEVERTEEKIHVFSGKEILQYYMDISTRTGSYSVWKCIFHRKAIEDIRFREGKINEDIDYHYKALRLCDKLVVSNQCKYFYFQSGDSLSTGGLKRRDFDLYDAANELFALTEQEDYGNIRFLGQVKKARTAFSLLSKISLYGICDKTIDEKALVRKLMKEHRKNATVLLHAPISFSRKVLVAGFLVSFTLTKMMIRAASRFILG